MTAHVTIDQLIINSPWEEPAKHWRYDRTRYLFDLADGRSLAAGHGRPLRQRTVRGVVLAMKIVSWC